MSKNILEGHPSEDVERTDQDRNGPVVNSNPSVLARLVQETPMGRGFVADGPDHEAVVGDVPLEEKSPSNIPTVDVNAPVDVTSKNVGSLAALLSHDESEHFRTRWNEVQGKFVDEPRSAVQQADALVSDVIEKITQMFANEHGALEEQWKEGKAVSTEDLRKALQHYRSFFNRLVV
jgi:hypothetical protein